MAKRLSDTPRLLQVIHLLPQLNGGWWERCDALAKLRRVLDQMNAGQLEELVAQTQDLHEWTGRLARHMKMARDCEDLTMRARGPTREDLGSDGFGGGV